MLQEVLIFLAIFAAVVGYKVIRTYLKKKVAFGGAEDDPMFFVSEDNELMNAAAEKARESIERFIAELNASDGDFQGSVKVKGDDDGEVEYMWLDKLEYREGTFYGDINNDPQSVTNVKFGDSWKVGKHDIHDWLYQKDGKLYGNFTYKAAIQKWPKEKQMIALKDYGDTAELAQEAVHESAPFLAGLINSMSDEEKAAFKEKANLDDSQKQELLAKLQKDN